MVKYIFHSTLLPIEQGGAIYTSNSKVIIYWLEFLFDDRVKVNENIT